MTWCGDLETCLLALEHFGAEGDHGWAYGRRST